MRWGTDSAQPPPQGGVGGQGQTQPLTPPLQATKQNKKSLATAWTVCRWPLRIVYTRPATNARNKKITSPTWREGGQRTITHPVSQGVAQHHKFWQKKKCIPVRPTSSVSFRNGRNSPMGCRKELQGFQEIINPIWKKHAMCWTWSL